MLRSEWNEPLRAQRDPLAEDAGRVRANRDDHRHWPRQSWLGRFVATYGWRAYALPVLAVVTVLVLYQTVTGGSRVYVERLSRPFADRIRINSGVRSVQRGETDGVVVTDANGDADVYDHVVLATRAVGP